MTVQKLEYKPPYITVFERSLAAGIPFAGRPALGIAAAMEGGCTQSGPGSNEEGFLPFRSAIKITIQFLNGNILRTRKKPHDMTQSPGKRLGGWFALMSFYRK